MATDWEQECERCNHLRRDHNDAGTECAACKGKCDFVGKVPLPALGSAYEYEGASYYVAAGYVPGSWADGVAKLVLVSFPLRTILHVSVSRDRGAGVWQPGRLIYREVYEH